MSWHAHALQSLAHAYVYVSTYTPTPTCAHDDHKCVCIYIHVHVHMHTLTTCTPHALCTHKQLPLTPLTSLLCIYVCICFVCVCIWKWLLQAQLCECVGVHVYTVLVLHGTVHWGNSPVLFWQYDFILKAAGHWWCISVCGGLGVGVGGVMPGLALFLSKHFAVL